MNHALILSALLNIIPVLLLLVGSAWTLARVFQLPDSVIAQSLTAFAGFLLALTPFLSQHQPLTRFGAANTVTLLRAGIVALFAGLLGPTAPIPSGMQSPFGARFDMEVDAFFILILAALVWQADKAGPWVILSGSLRYGFVVLGRWLPWLNRPLPPRRRRQTVCVIQTAVLALCLTSWRCV